MDYPRHNESYEDVPDGETVPVPDYFDPAMLLDFDLNRLIERDRYLNRADALTEAWSCYPDARPDAGDGPDA